MPDRHTLSVIRTALRAQLMTELQYRANLVLHLCQALVDLGIGLLMLSLVFSQVATLNGWTKPELLVLLGTFMIVAGLLKMFLRPNLELLGTDVWLGTLDHVLIKPTSHWLFLCVRTVRVWYATDVLMGTGVLIWALINLPGVTSFEIAIFCVTLLLGFVTLYGIVFALFLTVFWMIRTDAIADLFESIYLAGRWPLNIYPSWLRFGLTFVVPIAFVVTVPAEALTGKLSGYTILGELAFACAVAMLLRWFFAAALRSYTGAST